MAKNDVFQRIEAAQKLRDEADTRAKEILAGAVSDLKAERKSFENKIAEIDKHLETITGKSATPSGKGGKRVKSEAIVLEIIAKHKDGISHADIIAHEKMVSAYSALGKKVPTHYNKLEELVKAKKIGAKGERKERVFLPA